MLGAEQFGEFINEAGRAKAAQQQLAQSMAAAGEYSAEYVAELNEQAEALAKVTNFKDLEIQSAQRQLISLGATKEQMKTLLPLVLDFAAMTGGDASTAAMLLGKTLQGQEMGLARWGIVLDQSKDKFTALIEAIQRRAGGQAKAALAFPELHQMVEELEQVRRAAGGLIESVLRPFYTAFEQGAQTVKKVLVDLKTRFEKLGPFVQSVISSAAGTFT